MIPEFSVPLDRRVGKKTATALASLSLATVGDLLRHYPRRYVDRAQVSDLQELVLDEHVTVLARVQKVQSQAMRGRPGWRVQVTIGTETGELALVFFTAKAWQRDKICAELAVSSLGLFSGKLGQYQGQRQLANPLYNVLPDPNLVDADQAAQAHAQALRPIPIYRASSKISSWQIRDTTAILLAELPPIPDPIPAQLRQEHQLLDLSSALRSVHDPQSLAEAHRARYRLKFDEALVLQCVLVQRRLRARQDSAIARPVRSDGLLAQFDAQLPFSLTTGQREVGAQIAADLGQAHPMHRLLQGEVGSGKTLVALRAMLAVVDTGGQAALLAPTEVLATQHHRSISAMLGELGQAGQLTATGAATSVALLTGSQSVPVRRAELLSAASGAAGIVVGTHALLSEKVQFADLGLVVVDEQHRFGVEQRDALKTKAKVPPHLLVMTATPIPRTVAMTVFGDLEISVLRELPPGRSPVVSHLVPGTEPRWVARAWQRIAEEIAQGRQAFVVCPRIGGAEADGPQTTMPEDGGPPKRPPLAVVDVFAELTEEPALRGVRMAMLHGRLAADEREQVMRSFSGGDLDLLIATTVIEVGVDVPNATVMVVLDADRFGMSQLHQLRGRIGRGSAPGLALLVTEAEKDSPALARVQAVADTADGFKLATLDLDFRREGDVLGAAQSGYRSSLRLLRVLRDEKLITLARGAAEDLLAADPELVQYPELAAALADIKGTGQDEFLDRG